jgi:hypothetical protein
MAAADYRLCDVCNGKAFYDAHLNYEHGPSEYRPDAMPMRYAGVDQFADPDINQRSGMRLDYVGDWAVICTDCAKTHEVKIVQRAPAPEGEAK